MFAIKKTVLMTSLVMLTSAGTSYASMGTPVIGQPYAQVADLNTRDVVHDEASGTVAHSSSGACIRTQWSNGYDICSAQVAEPPGPLPSQQVRQTESLTREDRTVYFGFNQTSLSPEMRQRLDSLAAILKYDEQVKGAHIVGFADRIGNNGYNEKLSKKRAENVRQYMVAKGIINTNVAKTRWFGASNPASDCSASLKRPQLIDCLQPDRRVEVEIDFTPDVQANR